MTATTTMVVFYDNNRIGTRLLLGPPKCKQELVAPSSTRPAYGYHSVAVIGYDQGKGKPLKANYTAVFPWRQPS